MGGQNIFKAEFTQGTFSSEFSIFFTDSLCVWLVLPHTHKHLYKFACTNAYKQLPIVIVNCFGKLRYVNIPWYSNILIEVIYVNCTWQRCHDMWKFLDIFYKEYQGLLAIYLDCLVLLFLRTLCSLHCKICFPDFYSFAPFFCSFSPRFFSPFFTLFYPDFISLFYPPLHPAPPCSPHCVTASPGKGCKVCRSFWCKEFPV